MSSAQDFDERRQREELAKNIDESIEANAKLLMSLNGAGFLAISTIAGLFHINAAAMAWPVELSGGLFIAGSVVAGLVSVRRLSGLRYHEMTHSRTCIVAPPGYKLISIVAEASDPDDIENMFDNDAIVELAMGAIKNL
jgi:hypothetical protein